MASGSPATTAAAGGLLAAAVGWHRRQLQTRPTLTNSATSALLMALGDRAAQRIERDGRPLAPAHARASWQRTAILCGWSGGVSAPFWTWVYRAFARELPGRTTAWVAITACIGVPFNAAFFTWSASGEHLCEHAAPLTPAGRAAWAAAVRDKLATRLLPTVQSSLFVWPPVNFVAYNFVPLEYRLLFNSGFALGWNVFLSLQHGGRAALGGGAGGGLGSVERGGLAAGCSAPEGGCAAAGAQVSLAGAAQVLDSGAAR